MFGADIGHVSSPQRQHITAAPDYNATVGQASRDPDSVFFRFFLDTEKMVQGKLGFELPYFFTVKFRPHVKKPFKKG
jgi:hypothetical protein